MPGPASRRSRTRSFQVPASGLPSKTESGCAGRQRPVNGALAAVADGIGTPRRRRRGSCP